MKTGLNRKVQLQKELTIEWIELGEEPARLRLGWLLLSVVRCSAACVGLIGYVPMSNRPLVDGIVCQCRLSLVDPPWFKKLTCLFKLKIAVRLLVAVFFLHFINSLNNSGQRPLNDLMLSFIAHFLPQKPPFSAGTCIFLYSMYPAEAAMKKFTMSKL